MLVPASLHCWSPASTAWSGAHSQMGSGETSRGHPGGEDQGPAPAPFLPLTTYGLRQSQAPHPQDRDEKPPLLGCVKAKLGPNCSSS